MACFDEIFELGGGREMVSADRMRELLSVQRCHVSPSMIRLSNKSFSYDAALILSDVLRGFRAIQTADISDIIAGRPEDEALKVLKEICDSLSENSLEVVDISDNALGSKGVIACSAIFKMKSIKLQKLYICNNGMASESVELIADTLLTNGCPPLVALHFYNNMSGNAGAASVARIVSACLQLSDFRFSATRSSSVGCEHVARALLQLSGLTNLDLADNSFGDVSGQLLSQSILQQSNLQTLNLRDGGLGPRNGRSLLQSLITICPPLRVLDISGNDLDESSCGVIASLLSSTSSTLEEFSVDENEIQSSGAMEIATALFALPPSAALKSFSACTCELTAAGALSIASAVAKLPKFGILKIDGNQICVGGIRAIQEVMSKAEKNVEEMEDNDDDGEDDLDEGLQFLDTFNFADELSQDLSRACI